MRQRDTPFTKYQVRHNRLLLSRCLWNRHAHPDLSRGWLFRFFDFSFDLLCVGTVKQLSTTRIISILYFIPTDSLIDPQLRVSNEQIPIVRVP